jgi:hypothetical protein
VPSRTHLRGGGCQAIGEVARAITTIGLLGDGEKVRVFGKEMGFWRRTRYARFSVVI